MDFTSDVVGDTKEIAFTKGLAGDKIELVDYTNPSTPNVLLNVTGTEQEILDSKVSVKYDATTKKVIFTKKGYAGYSNPNLRLNALFVGPTDADKIVKESILLTLVNAVGFEILPGKGSLNFGDFFPGDTKFAENLIEFKNPNNHNIKVELDTNNKEEIYKVGVPATETTTINLKELQVKDLKATPTTKRNSFKISGKAVTKATTEPGEYSGSLDVIITIIP